VFFLFGGLSFGLVFLKEEALRLLYLTRFGQTQFRKRIILVGDAGDTGRLRKTLAERSPESLEVLAELDLNEQPVNELVRLLHEHSANAVVLNAKHTYFGQMEKAIQACELEGVETWLVADFFKTQISRTSLDDFYGLPMLVFRSGPEISWQGLCKQLLDYVGALVLMVLSSPLFLVAPLLIKLTSRGPVLFRQQRCGLNGQPFTMLKFRSMVSDAEQRQHELATLNEMSGPVFKVTNDPRITWIGRILRKYSLDEFPQLLNVLRGEMSLVGPRPLPVDEVKRFDDLAHRRRLSVKPGLTCLWQIRGRNEVRDFKDWVRLDLEYIDHWSLWLDLKILWRTIPVVLRGTGAK
jgi:exopolysaccharide biosynthesis polyprenyl glycosylphosphotransferase